MSRIPINEWVSIEERLPRECVDVLVTDCYEVGIGYFVKHEDGSWHCVTTLSISEDGEWVSTNDVTHWMPLPEMPDPQEAYGGKSENQ